MGRVMQVLDRGFTIMPAMDVYQMNCSTGSAVMDAAAAQIHVVKAVTAV